MDDDLPVNLDAYSPPAAFERFEEMEPSRYVRDYGPIPFKAMVVVHCFAVCSFVGRAVCLGRQAGWDEHRLEVREILAIALLYFAVGVVFPVRAKTVAAHTSLRLLLGVQYHYDWYEPGGIPDMKYLWISKMVWPLFFILGMLAPILVWVPMFVQSRSDTSIIGPCMLEVDILVSIVSWSLGMMVFGAAKVEEVCLDATNKVVDGLIKDIIHKTDAARGVFSWRKIARKTMTIDRVLGEAYAIRAVGGLWAGRVVVLFSMGIVLSGASIVHSNRIMRVACSVASVVCAAGGTSLLWRLGKTTQKCSGTRSASNSIPSALYGSSIMAFGSLSEDEAVQWLYLSNLKTFLATRKMGIYIFGTLITRGLVMTIGIRVCVYIPVATAVVGKLLHGD